MESNHSITMVAGYTFRFKPLISGLSCSHSVFRNKSDTFTYISTYESFTKRRSLSRAIKKDCIDISRDCVNN